MKICIDTNIYAAYRKGNPAITRVLEEADQILISVVVLGELYAGFYLGSRTKGNLIELETFLMTPGIIVVETDRVIAEKYGHLIRELKHQGTPIPTNDVWIAATALTSNAKLMTFDHHFECIPGVMVFLHQ